jgi:hypothetical protein
MRGWTLQPHNQKPAALPSMRQHAFVRCVPMAGITLSPHTRLKVPAASSWFTLFTHCMNMHCFPELCHVAHVHNLHAAANNHLELNTSSVP